MNLKQNYLTESGCYKAGKRITVKGLMIHSVGCPQPKADVFMKELEQGWRHRRRRHLRGGRMGVGGSLFAGVPWVALRRRRKQYPHRGGNGGACHHQIYGRLKLDGDRGWGKHEEPCACRLQMCGGVIRISLSAVRFGPMADGVIISHSEGCKRALPATTGRGAFMV